MMPTSKPRLTITLDETLQQAIENYQFSNRCKNQTQAILTLIEAGLAASGKSVERPQQFSKTAKQIALIYDKELGSYDRKLLQLLALQLRARNLDEITNQKPPSDLNIDKEMSDLVTGSKD